MRKHGRQKRERVVLNVVERAKVVVEEVVVVLRRDGGRIPHEGGGDRRRLVRTLCVFVGVFFLARSGNTAAAGGAGV